MKAVRGPRLWLRWSLRDLRSRWLQVVVITLVLGIGIGLYTGLGSMQTWREDSQDVSYEMLRVHDLRLSLGEGGFVRQGQLRALTADPALAADVAGVEERLVAATQLDASFDGVTVLTPGRIVGAGSGSGALSVDALDVDRGTSSPGAVVIETQYAKLHGLPITGTLRVAGGGQLDYSGHGRSPEYFIVTGPTGAGFGSEENFGVVFAPLDVAQRAARRPSMVNELVVRLRPGADLGRFESALRGRLSSTLPGVGATLTRGTDEDAYRLLYDDAAGDQQMFDVFALLVLAGAALAVFNLVSRVVEAGRREIGVGMALGVPTRRLAIRPFALGAQIAVLGLVLGIPIGLLANALLRQALVSLLPLPVLETRFQWSVFAGGAAIGLALPFLAAAYPVFRALRVTPIEAIRVGFRTASGSGLAPLVRRLPMPWRSLGRMPLRNVVRTPRRTVMTLLGIGAVVALVVAFAGMVSSFIAPLERSGRDVLRGSPDRMVVDLAGYLPADGAAVQGALADPAVARAEARLRVPGLLRRDGREVEAVVELLDPRSELWAPQISRGTFGPGSDGIVLAEKAAADLGVGIGDTVVMRHPVLTAAGRIALVETPVAVTALHPNPLRFSAYMDSSAAQLMGLAGTANMIVAVPTAQAGQAGLVRALFGRPGVASIQSAAALTDSLLRQMRDFVGVIRVVEAAALLLALLIAFNSTSIAMDERTREHATMLAFGVSVPTAVRLNVVEGLIIGVLGTLIGIAGGVAIIGWVNHELMSATFPELAPTIALDLGVLAAAAAVGVGAMLVAPLLSTRRLRRLDIPSALRVVE